MPEESTEPLTAAPVEQPLDSASPEAEEPSAPTPSRKAPIFWSNKRFLLPASVVGLLLLIAIVYWSPVRYVLLDWPKTFTNSINMEFILIPAGEFLMGSTQDEIDRLVQRYGDDWRKYFERELPQHQVRISQSFYLGKYQVTQAEWQAVMGENPSSFKGDPNRPVENVSWNEVQQFIRKLNEKEGSNKYRLPTEAEWEYAARAGTTTAYSFGDAPDQLGEYAWFDDNSGNTTHPVGQLKPNPWGLYDMHGNVFEWVEDWYGKYPAEPVTDPTGPPLGADRVLRGGSCCVGADYCRSAYRRDWLPATRLDGLGFRLARSARNP
jgi:formylglycine-generating enzyme required for sulfatase activity